MGAEERRVRIIEYPCRIADRLKKTHPPTHHTYTSKNQNTNKQTVMQEPPPTEKQTPHRHNTQTKHTRACTHNTQTHVSTHARVHTQGNLPVKKSIIAHLTCKTFLVSITASNTSSSSKSCASTLHKFNKKRNLQISKADPNFHMHSCPLYQQHLHKIRVKHRSPWAHIGPHVECI